MLSAAEKKSAQGYRWLLAYIDETKFSGFFFVFLVFVFCC